VADAFTAANAIMRRLNAAAQPGAQSVVSRALNRESDLGQSTLDDITNIAGSYRAAVDTGNQLAVDQIVARWSEVRATVVETLPETLPDGTEYKAFYSAPDFYPPWRYERIFRDSAAVVAIGEPGKNTARCSGVLIAEISCSRPGTALQDRRRRSQRARSLVRLCRTLRRLAACASAAQDPRRAGGPARGQVA
jgi:hypothetical protein